MIKRDDRGHSYCAARGEILEPAQDGGSKMIRYMVVPTVNDAELRFGGIIPMTRQAACGKP